MSLVDAVIEDNRWQAVGLETLAARAAEAALGYLSVDMAAHEISLLGCDDARIAELNESFRGKAKPTNVLSWPSEDLSPDEAGGAPLPPEMEELGDIALAYETCVSEADAAGKPLNDHVTHLIIHGVLHLMGYDHETEEDAVLMEGLEVRILASLGLPDPYGAAS